MRGSGSGDTPPPLAMGPMLAGLLLSDRGVEYLAIRYTERLAETDAVNSVGSKRDSYDCEQNQVRYSVSV